MHHPPSIGLLRIVGTLDLTQFFPRGDADGDTVHIDVEPHGVAFAPSLHGRLVTTRVLDHAVAVGRVRRIVLDDARRMTVRLEALDAPELHYAAQGARGSAYRQHFGALVPMRLAAHLQAHAHGATRVRCVLMSNVAHPSDAFDTYGRCVGRLLVGDANHVVDVNEWLLTNGLAMPAFYASLTPPEMTRYRELARAARRARRGVWRHYGAGAEHARTQMLAFDRAAMDATHDAGPVVWPKLFRERVLWRAAREANSFDGTFAAYLAKGLRAFRADEWLAAGAEGTARTRAFTEFVRAGSLCVAPEEIVLPEASVTLHDAHGHALVSG